MYRILHIFSESDELSQVKTRLRESGEGIKVESAASITDALDAAASESYDCIVVEDHEGGDNGMALLRTLRNRHIDTPVILSSQGSVDERVQQAYADDRDAHVEIMNASGEPFHSVVERIIYSRAERTIKSRRPDAVVENPHLYRLLFETVPTPLLLIDADGRIAVINNAAVALLKYRSSAELVGNPVIKLFPLAYNSTGMADVRTLMNSRTAGYRSFHWRMITKNGEYCSTEAVGYPVTFEGAQLTAVSLREMPHGDDQTPARADLGYAVRESAPAAPLNILVICDGMVMRSGLQLMLGNQQDRYQFVEYSAGEMKDELQGSWDGILFARSSFNDEGLAQLRDLVSQAGQTPIMVATLTGVPGLFVQALKVGARGIVQTETEFDAIPRAMRQISEGAYWLSRSLVRGSIEQLDEPQERRKEPVPAPLAALTRREREILGLLAQGQKNKKIAEKLSLSYRTVVTHVYNIYRKLKISSRTEAIHYAIMHRVIEIDQ